MSTKPGAGQFVLEDDRLIVDSVATGNDEDVAEIGQKVEAALNVYRGAFAEWIERNPESVGNQATFELKNAIRELDSAFLSLVILSKFIYGACLPVGSIGLWPTEGTYSAIRSDVLHATLMSGTMPNLHKLDVSDWPLLSRQRSTELTNSCREGPEFVRLGREWIDNLRRLTTAN